MIEPGEIYMADFGAAGPHPVIVVSREDLNRGRYALVVVCTSARLAVRRIAFRFKRGTSASPLIAWLSVRMFFQLISRSWT
jgi:mRNA-degrading endonuclease toxin of MazEF toxin-antitoxin module